MIASLHCFTFLRVSHVASEAWNGDWEAEIWHICITNGGAPPAQGPGYLINRHIIAKFNLENWIEDKVETLKVFYFILEEISSNQKMSTTFEKNLVGQNVQYLIFFVRT